MMPVLVLLLAGAVIATTGDQILIGRRWVPAAPGSAVAAWLLLLVTGTVAVLGAGAVAVVPLLRHLGGLREFVHRCPAFLVALHSHTWYLLLASVGATVTVAGTAWLVVVIRRHLRVLRRDSQRHRLALVADGQGQRPVAVLASDRCAAWSVPAGSGYVVVTDAALRDLTREQLDAVIRHERAHLRGRHHLVLTLVRALRVALPCRLTRAAAAEVAVLLEMRADDVAVAGSDRAVLRAALQRMAAVPETPATLAMTGGSVQRRLRRLVAPPVGARWQSVAVVASGLVVLAGLAVLLAGTLATVVLLHECPLPT